MGGELVEHVARVVEFIIWSENLKGRNNLKDLGVDEMVLSRLKTA